MLSVAIGVARWDDDEIRKNTVHSASRPDWTDLNWNNLLKYRSCIRSAQNNLRANNIIDPTMIQTVVRIKSDACCLKAENKQ